MTVDYYATRPAYIDAFVKTHLQKYLPTDPTCTPIILDPAAGDGRILYSIGDVLDKALMMGVEIHDEPAYTRNEDWGDDISIASFTRTDFMRWESTVQCDMIITNPPFSQAKKFVEHSLPMLTDDGCLVLLLRLGFISTQARTKALWSVDGGTTMKTPLRRIHILPVRPSFIAGSNKTDNSEYAWFVWQKNYEGLPELTWMTME